MDLETILYYMFQGNILQLGRDNRIFRAREHMLPEHATIHAHETILLIEDHHDSPALLLLWGLQVLSPKV